MRMVEGGGDRPKDLDHPLGLEALVADQLRERPALDVLHNDQGVVLDVDDVEDRRQAGMAEGCAEPRLANDPLALLFRAALAQALHGHAAA